MSLGRLKPLVNDPVLWKAFEEYVQSKIKFSHEQMERQVDPVFIYREQGRTEALRKLLKLRDEVNGADDRQGHLLK